MIPERCYTSQPLWNESLDLTAIEEQLLQEPITQLIDMAAYLKSLGKEADFTSNVFVATLANGLKAVFKPGYGRHAEVAAYKASKFLRERPLVPPTVLRTINSKEGSLQLLIESTFDLVKDENVYRTLFSQLNPKDLSDMKLFYFIFGQWDIGRSNQIIQRSHDHLYLALIDNASIFYEQHVRYGDFAFVCIGKSKEKKEALDSTFPPFDNPCILRNASLEQVQATFGNFLDAQSIMDIWQRVKRIVYCIWNNGLWIQYYKNQSLVGPNFTNIYFQSTIDAYKKLDQAALEAIWSEALSTKHKNHVLKLIALTLERRDQVLRAIEKEKIALL